MYSFGRGKLRRRNSSRACFLSSRASSSRGSLPPTLMPAAFPDQPFFQLSANSLAFRANESTSIPNGPWPDSPGLSTSFINCKFVPQALQNRWPSRDSPPHFGQYISPPVRWNSTAACWKPPDQKLVFAQLYASLI